jgi:hypothetical protein
MNRCTLSGNSARYGGGTHDVTLNNCNLRSNAADYYGGGASGGGLNNCTLTGNSAYFGGGGSYEGTLNNCILYYNTAGSGSDSNFFNSTLRYCCTTPLPGGSGNITNEPAFLDYAGGNLRLQSNSPCINAGRNAVVSATTDLDGQSRIVAETVDIGAYEFPSPASLISYAWLQQFGLPVDGSADDTDSDGDLLNNTQEWRCRTDPTNALSVLRLLTPLPTANDVNVSWQSEAGVDYFLERSTNLAASTPFLPLATNLIGQVGTTTFTDTNTPGPQPSFYRIGVGY